MEKVIINRYTCAERARENINYFRGEVYATSGEAAVKYGRGHTTVGENEFATRADAWGVALEIAREMVKGSIKKGKKYILGLQ